MNRIFRTWIHSLALFAFLSVAGTNAAAPNIVFIFADDWGWGDLSSHGHPWLQTPHLDQLAREGIDFQQFNVLNPVCSHSRAAVMPGHFPSRYSIHQHFASPTLNRERGMPDWLDSKAPTVARFLQQAGYRTGHFGKWHLTNRETRGAPNPTAYGFDENAVFNGGADTEPAGLQGAPNLDQRFKNFDKNGDGQLSRQEFISPSGK